MKNVSAAHAPHSAVTNTVKLTLSSRTVIIVIISYKAGFSLG